MSFKYSATDSKGFTIVELLIATAVFGVMMLFATSGLIQMGRAYYKGITSAKTQEIARSVERDITDTVRNGSDTAINTGVEDPATPTGFNIKSYCIGSTRYTYVLDAKVASSNNATPAPVTIRHALWVDKLASTGSGCTPVDLRLADPSSDISANWGGVTSDPSAAGQRRDLLASNMRLTKFDVIPAGVTGVSVNIRTLYGDDLVIEPSNKTCKPLRSGGQFCAFSELGTFVERR